MNFIFLNFIFLVSSFGFSQSLNDDPCGAIELFPNISCNYSTYNNNGSTLTTTPSYIFSKYSTTVIADADVWFKIKVPSNGVLIIDTKAGSLTDVDLGLYSGSSCSGTLTLLNCNESTNISVGTNDMAIIAQNNLTPGAYVWVRVSNILGDMGTFGICVTSPTDLHTVVANTPASDDCTNAPLICNLDGYAGTTVGYSPTTSWTQLVNSLPANTSLQNDAYLKITAAKTTISFNIWMTSSQEGQGIQIFLFSAPSCGDGNPVAMNSYYWSPLRITHGVTNVSFSNLTVGQTYYLVFDGAYSDQCDFVIGAPADGGGLAVTTYINPATSQICLGDYVDLTCVGGSGGYDWTSSPNVADLNATNTVTVRATPTTLGIHTYNVTATQINTNCPTSPGVATINVTPPGVNTPIAGDTSICVNETTVLTNSSAGGTWTVNNSNVSIYVNPTTNSCTVTGLIAGTAEISYTSCNTMKRTIIINNSSNPKIYDLTGANNKFCLFKFTDTLKMTSNTGATSGLWTYIAPSTGGEATFLSNSDFNTGIQINKYGDYKFIFQELVCNNKDSLIVNFRPGAYAYLDSVVTVCTGSSHEFIPSFTYPEYILSKVWSTGAVTPTITVKDQNVYSLEVSTGCGNDYTAYSKLFVKDCDIKSIPNVITPNGDGVNDTFKISIEDGIFKAFDIVITNRWGSVITQYIDPKAAWNGKNKAGEIVDEGVYFYSLNAETIEGKKIEKQGFIHVIYE